MSQTTNNKAPESAAAGKEGPAAAIGRDAPVKPKRFYKAVSVVRQEGDYSVRLDERPIKSPSKKLLVVPTEACAEAIAAEWRAQGEQIDVETMPLLRLANTALDRVYGREAAIVAEMEEYAGSDLLCYYAEGPEGLLERQVRAWSPVLKWAEGALGARFNVTAGIVHVAQDEAALGAIRQAVEGQNAHVLAALYNMMTLTGSIVLALAVGHGAVAREKAWSVAHVDEDWQIEQWGRDDLAEQRRAARHSDFCAAYDYLNLCGGLARQT